MTRLHSGCIRRLGKALTFAGAAARFGIRLWTCSSRSTAGSDGIPGLIESEAPLFPIAQTRQVLSALKAGGRRSVLVPGGRVMRS